MTSRALRLERLLAVRRIAEEMDRGSLASATAAVTQVEAAIQMQVAAIAEAGVAGRAALEQGERSEWLMADAQIEVGGWNCTGLLAVLRTREAAVAPAFEQYFESRRELEQVKLLVMQSRCAAKLLEDHRAQAAADDWFLSRRLRRDGFEQL